jgi:hypothetical protein
MKAEALRNELVGELTEFAAGQWAQLGASFAPPAAAEQRAADPEALLLFTLHLGRRAPRLFDEALDWLARNESLVSTHRLRSLATGNVDRSLMEASLDWTAAQRRRAKNQRAEPLEADSLEPLFAAIDVPKGRRDPHFAHHGWARPVLRPSGKSQPPPLDAPIAFAFRLRRLLGIGVRAEIVRSLLTIRAPRVSSRMIAATTGFAQRNVREGLIGLHEAGVLTRVDVADDPHYGIDAAAWATLLGLERAPDLPFHHDWIPGFRTVTSILRWLDQPGLDELSPYMRGSQGAHAAGRARGRSAPHRRPGPHAPRPQLRAMGRIRRRRAICCPHPHQAVVGRAGSRGPRSLQERTPTPREVQRGWRPAPLAIERTWRLHPRPQPARNPTEPRGRSSGRTGTSCPRTASTR